MLVLCLLLRYNKLTLSDWLQSCNWGHGALGLDCWIGGWMGAWRQGSASVLCASASASVQLIINKYGCVLCASWLVQLMVLKYIINHSFLDLDLSYMAYIFLCCTNYWLFFFLLSNTVIVWYSKWGSIKQP